MNFKCQLEIQSLLLPDSGTLWIFSFQSIDNTSNRCVFFNSELVHIFDKNRGFICCLNHFCHDPNKHHHGPHFKPHGCFLEIFREINLYFDFTSFTTLNSNNIFTSPFHGKKTPPHTIRKYKHHQMKIELLCDFTNFLFSQFSWGVDPVSD